MRVSHVGCGSARKLSRDLRVIIFMTKPDIWYVAFSPDKNSDPNDGTARSTRRFKSEVDAKLFAMQILAKGWTATAGTLNPYQPKQVIAASQIERWADPGLGG